MAFPGTSAILGAAGGKVAWEPPPETLGWWPFGDVETFEDQTTPAYDWGTSTSPPTINNDGGTEVMSAQFVSANQQFLTQANIATSGDASAAIWIKWTTVADAWLFQMRGISSADWGWQIILLSGSVLAYLRTTDGAAIGPALIQATPATGTWYCYGMTIDNTAKTLTPYLDGVAGTPVSFTGKTARYNGIMRIGGAGWTTIYPFNGRANDALYVNKAFSDSEHLAFFNGRKSYYGL